MFLVFYFFVPGGFCQSAALRWRRRGVPLQHAVCVSAVGSDLQTGQNPGRVPDRSRPSRDDPAGSDRPGAQYPTNVRLLVSYFYNR